MATATLSRSAINVAVAADSAWLARAHAHARAAAPAMPRGRTRSRAHGAVAVYVAIALSGLTALGAEVVWTRCCRCCSAPRSTRSRSSSACSSRAWASAAASASALARDAQAAARCSRDGASCCLCRRDRLGARMIARSLPYWPINPTLSHRARGSSSSSIWCARSGPCFPAACSGARAFRWRSPRRASAHTDAGSGRLVGARLRRQHRGRDRRRSLVFSTGPDSVDRHAGQHSGMLMCDRGGRRRLCCSVLRTAPWRACRGPLRRWSGAPGRSRRLAVVPHCTWPAGVPAFTGD